MKFFNLFKKELREMVTVQTLVGLLVSVIIFVALGQVIGNMGEEMSRQMGSVVVVDQDQSSLSKSAVESLKEKYEVSLIEGNDELELAAKAKDLGHSSALLIPKGFEESLNAGSPQELSIINMLTSFSVFSNTDSSASSAAEIIKEKLSSDLIQGQDGAANVDFIQNPVSVSEITVANGKSERVNSAALQGFAMQQSIFIPVIVFILIIFASQLNISAVANEKGDKTLETLLSTPVSRLSVLGAKMSASAVLSLLMALVYMVGFGLYMGNMTTTMSGVSADMIDGSMEVFTSLVNLGLALSPLQYLLIGIQLFLTIMIALALSMILGALAKDLKSAQGLIAPLTFAVMIPYFVSMFADIEKLPVPLRLLMDIIPFTHTFTASANLIFENYASFFGGMAYQAIILVLVLYLAVRVFSTDKIFTMTLDFSKKKKKKISADAS